MAAVTLTLALVWVASQHSQRRYVGAADSGAVTLGWIQAGGHSGL